MRRYVLIAAAVLSACLLTIPSVMSSELQRPAEFVSGTGLTIPTGTAGSIDTTSHTDLQFRYRGSVFAVPYQKIATTQTATEGGWHIWKVPVPKLGKSARLLTIAYKNGDDTTGSITFRTSAANVSSLINIIDERKSPEAAEASLKVRREAARISEEDWWGNKYWRTLRNKSKWPQPADTQSAPSGTKE